MKTWIPCLALAILAWGCSTVQTARLDTTLPPKKSIAVYQGFDALAGKTYRPIAYLAYDKPVRDQNYTAALGAVLDKARQLGADALIVETPREGVTNAVVFRGTAIVFQP